MRHDCQHSHAQYIQCQTFGSGPPPQVLLPCTDAHLRAASLTPVLITPAHIQTKYLILAGPAARAACPLPWFTRYLDFFRHRATA